MRRRREGGVDGLTKPPIMVQHRPMGKDEKGSGRTEEVAVQSEGLDEQKGVGKGGRVRSECENQKKRKQGQMSSRVIGYERPGPTNREGVLAVDPEIQKPRRQWEVEDAERMAERSANILTRQKERGYIEKARRSQKSR